MEILFKGVGSATADRRAVGAIAELGARDQKDLENATAGRRRDMWLSVSTCPRWTGVRLRHRNEFRKKIFPYGDISPQSNKKDSLYAIKNDVFVFFSAIFVRFVVRSTNKKPPEGGLDGVDERSQGRLTLRKVCDGPEIRAQADCAGCPSSSFRTRYRHAPINENAAGAF